MTVMHISCWIWASSSRWIRQLASIICGSCRQHNSWFTAWRIQYWSFSPIQMANYVFEHATWMWLQMCLNTTTTLNNLPNHCKVLSGQSQHSNDSMLPLLLPCLQTPRWSSLRQYRLIPCSQISEANDLHLLLLLLLLLLGLYRAIGSLRRRLTQISKILRETANFSRKKPEIFSGELDCSVRVHGCKFNVALNFPC